MNNDSERLAIEGIRFFGEMSASISHEMKNVLAIINENAGLLQDVVQMSADGAPLSLERLSAVARSIGRQVARGDRIIKGMNRFAHSADHPVETVNVGEVLEFIIDLGNRLIAMRGVSPRIEAPAEALTVAANRFFLEDLIWNCLRRAMDTCADGQSLAIVVEAYEGAARIRFSGLVIPPQNDGTDFFSPRETVVARLLNAGLFADREKGEIRLVLP